MFAKLTRFLKAALTALIIIVCVIFCIVNREIATISLFPLPYSADLPKFLLAIIFFTCGLIVGGTVISLRLNRISRILRKEHKHVNALQNEVQALRAENNAANSPNIAQLKSA